MKHILLSIALFILYASILTGTVTAQPVVIPTVFHILHEGGTENISDQQVLDAIRILNDNYGKKLPDSSGIIAPFRNIIANMGIEFRLANKDPQGNCTNGIQHIYTTSTNFGNDNNKLPDWPGDKYLNIWVVKSISLYHGAVAAYTYYPWTADTMAQFDGIIILNEYVGSIGTGSAYTSHSLTYEMGHYLGLLPMCEGATNNACSDDSVQDTPPCRYTVGCAPDSFCGTVDNYENFMGTIYCGSMFTNGQKARVLNWLNHSTAQRNNLWTGANLIATGAADTNAIPCAPVCDFIASNSFICLGDVVTLYDISYNDTVTARSWSFSNANISTSTNPSVSVTFNTSGWQTVSLTVMNAQGNSQKTQTLVYVADPNAVVTPTPYYTNFADSADFDHNWISVNPDNDMPHFQQVNSGGLSAVLLNNYTATMDGTYDDLITPAFDCSALIYDSAHVSFRYSLATRDEDTGRLYTTDSIGVYANLSCIYGWTKIYAEGSPSFINAGVNSSFFYPGSNSALWSKVTILLAHQYLQPDVRFKIRVYGAHNSNNLYLTDFVVGYEATGIAEDKLSNLAIVPNPFTNYVSVNGLEAGKYKIDVYDMTGRLMADETVTGGGERTFINLNTVTANGIYFVKITGQQGSGTFKLVKN